MYPPDPRGARDRRPPDPGWRGVAVAVAIAVAIPVGLWALSAPLLAATVVAAIVDVALLRRFLSGRGEQEVERSGQRTRPATENE